MVDVCFAVTLGGKSGSQSIYLLFELSHSAISLLLPFPARGRYDALSAGFAASFASVWAIDFIEFAFDLETPTCLACPWSFQVIGIGRVAARALGFRWAILCSRLLLYSTLVNRDLGEMRGATARGALDVCKAGGQYTLAEMNKRDSEYLRESRDSPGSNSESAACPGRSCSATVGWAGRESN